MLRLAVLAWLGNLATKGEATPRARACENDADCSYNGTCDSAGRCLCKSQFQGSQCDVFKLAPSDKRKDGIGLKTLTTSPVLSKAFDAGVNTSDLPEISENATCQNNLCHPCTPPINGSGPGTCCNKTWHCFYDRVFGYNLCLPPYHWICSSPP